ncbi:hypothetical protein SDC9_145196 [bioreactor metagenome]|uniref:Uncharacterized protein n=1 Tax=bioreactor metagenome TaxID=1076179 RepID=A0A645E968_9ZZZZ
MWKTPVIRLKRVYRRNRVNDMKYRGHMGLQKPQDKHILLVIIRFFFASVQIYLTHELSLINDSDTRNMKVFLCGEKVASRLGSNRHHTLRVIQSLVDLRLTARVFLFFPLQILFTFRELLFFIMLLHASAGIRLEKAAVSADGTKKHPAVVRNQLMELQDGKL